MDRAGIFIGVNRTGQLQTLQDAAKGARRMRDWAVSQGMTPDAQARLITDDDGESVGRDQIYRAVKQILDGPGVDQLILYFAGHGVNRSRNEYWLLSDAPEDTSAAVNVTGTVELARYSGIPHVVVISDACRVAPEGIQAQNVSGADVFPNQAAATRARPVDQFFACALGATAAEIRDPHEAAASFRALYTDVLVDALSGACPEVLEPAPDEERCAYVRPRTLQGYLETAVPRKIREMNLQARLNQEPDAIITSDRSWLARLAGVATRGSRGATRGPDLKRTVDRMRSGMERAFEHDLPWLMDLPEAPTVGALAHGLVRDLTLSSVEGRPARLDARVSAVRGLPVDGAGALGDMVERLAAPAEMPEFQTRCGIRAVGAEIEGVFAAGGVRAHSAARGGSAWEVDLGNRQTSSLVLRFANETGTVVPALRDFVAVLTFAGRELADVSYEPYPGTPRWRIFEHQREQIRGLHAAAAAASHHGRFRLERRDAQPIAIAMQSNKGSDPTLAIYAAYAYHDLQDAQRLLEMSSYLSRDPGIAFFDVELLARHLIGQRIGHELEVVPFVPMLAQGWALLAAHQVKLHPRLAGLEGTLLDSLWSLYDARGVEMLRAALASGEVR